MKVADHIADYFARQGITHCFGIVGAGNVALFDAIARRGATQIVATHQEQAAAQAATAYWRICGRLAPVLLTTGAGSANAITGVINAWMDSVPLLVLSGNETSQALAVDGRIKGAQGYATGNIAKPFTKISLTWHEFLPGAFEHIVGQTSCGRFGPVWLDFPRDVWSATVPVTELEAA